MKAREAYLEGLKNNFRGYSPKRLKDLAMCDNPVRYIYEAGLYWQNFDFIKGQNALLENDDKGHFIYLAGVNWNTFNFAEGLQRLKEINKEGNILFRVKQSWNITEEQKDDIDKFYNSGYWIYIDFRNGNITEKEALEKGLNIKWKRKLSKFAKIKKIRKENEIKKSY